MEITPRRRRALSTVLALVLAVESVTAVAAAARVNVAGRDAAGTPADPPSGALALAAAAAPGNPTVDAARSPGSGVADRRAPGAGSRSPEVASEAMQAPSPAPSERPAPAQEAKADKSSRAGSSPRAGSGSPAEYRGRNHVWIPALRINRSVQAFPCSRSRKPDNYVYRWGCAGTNNVYLMGHAYSVFKPLHDAYVTGRLTKGMTAWYADADGRVRAYKVKWWRVTAPTTEASWAWAPQSAPSMTLQTCVGRNSQYRLMVRLVEVRP